MRPLIAPSLLSADFACLKQEVMALEQAGADWVHWDVMDGHFVPNLTLGPPIIKALRSHTSLVFDVHLMIEKPSSMVDWFIEAGADRITIHLEAEEEAPLKACLDHIRKRGKKAGLALSPKTGVTPLPDLLGHVDLVLIMTVNPGFGGQAFMQDQLSKIEKVRTMIDAVPHEVLLEVDGGIDASTVPRVLKAGGQVLVSGTGVFGEKSEADPHLKAERYRAAINQLRGHDGVTS